MILFDLSKLNLV